MNRVKWLRHIDVERIIHSFKTMIACFLALTLISFSNFGTGQWIIVSIIVVMCGQIYVGSVLHKSWYRFLGTMAGCLLASLAISQLGVTHLSIAIAIGCSAFFFSYIATGWENLTYAGVLGAVTTTTIMLGQNPTLIFALERFLEISIGILIAAVVSQLILPIHARTHLRRAQAESLQQLSDYYEIILTSEKPHDPNFDYHDIDEAIVKSLLKQRQLAKESRSEPFGKSFDPKHFIQVLFAEREILRCISFIHAALFRLGKQADALQATKEYQEFNALVTQALKHLSENIESGKQQNNNVHIPSLIPLKNSIQLNKNNYTENEYLYLNSYLFAAELLLKNLSRIAKLSGTSLIEN